MLVLALTIYEAGLCGCGHPVVIAHDEQSDGWFGAKKVQCHSCAAQERATTGNGKDPYVPQPGEKVYTTYDAEGRAKSDARKNASRNPTLPL